MERVSDPFFRTRQDEISVPISWFLFISFFLFCRIYRIKRLAPYWVERNLRKIYREIEKFDFDSISRGPDPSPPFLTRFHSKVASVETRFEGWKR